MAAEVLRAVLAVPTAGLVARAVPTAGVVGTAAIVVLVAMVALASNVTLDPVQARWKLALASRLWL